MRVPLEISSLVANEPFGQRLPLESLGSADSGEVSQTEVQSLDNPSSVCGTYWCPGVQANTTA
jgi:hypothetical protein